MRYARAWMMALVLSGCTPPRFADAPVVWRLSDRHDIPEPEENHFALYAYYADAFVVERLSRGLGVPDPQAAGDVNALDEVPDSTWFENRIGLRPLGPEHVARGPGGPAPRLPLTVTGGKSAGASLGFMAEDAAGRRYLIKLDDPAHPEMQTANAAIASRLFWALGYHVPAEHVFTFRETDVHLDAEATMKDEVGDDVLYTHRALDTLLAKAPRTPDGSIRALASLLLEGEPKGGFPPWGRREDDPNDSVPHQHRRVLRGLRVFCTWLDHADINEQNTLDMYVKEDGRRFLRHHLVDFGESMGALFPDRPWVSHAYLWDWEYHGLAIFTFGLWERPWETAPAPPPHLGIGRFYADGWDPTAWQEAKPYLPFFEATDADLFWAAKIVLRFRRPHLEAAVAEGKLSDPAASRYLVRTLARRRDAIGQAWVASQTSVDRFVVEDGRLCMTDLAVRYRLARGGAVERLIDGEPVAHARLDRAARACLPIDDAPYQIFELRSVRSGEAFEPIEVHVKGGRDARVLGVLREHDFG